MLTDRYDLTLSTASAPARDAYVEVCGLLFTGYPGAITVLDHAMALSETGQQVAARPKIERSIS
jgi:hypothetical protein